MTDLRVDPAPVLELFGPGPLGLVVPGGGPTSAVRSRSGPGKRRERGAPRGPAKVRGRHIRGLGGARVAPTVVVPDLESPAERVVLHVLRARPVDLDVTQIAALSALPPSLATIAVQRLVQVGLARDLLVGGRLRYGLA